MWSKVHAVIWPFLCDWGLVSDDDVAPPLCVFAEGTTTNGTDLIQFRTGAFLQQQPVQPVVLTYHWRHASPSWETVPNHHYAMQMLSQLGHAVTITYLPVVEPVDSVTDLVPSMLVSRDPAVQEGSNHRDPPGFAALVRTRMREYLALRHAHESNSLELPVHYAEALNSMSPRMLFPMPGSGVSLPAALVDIFRRVCFGSGFLWFQPFWSSHALQPSEKWSLHDRIRSGDLPWQWWRRPYVLPRQAEGNQVYLQTVPAAGGFTSVACMTMDTVLPAPLHASHWTAKLVYAPATLAAWAVGDAIVYPGWSTPAGPACTSDFVFVPPSGESEATRSTSTQLNFNVESSVHSPTGTLVSAAAASQKRAISITVDSALDALGPAATQPSPDKRSPGTGSGEDPSSSHAPAAAAAIGCRAAPKSGARNRIKRVSQSAVSASDTDSDSTLPPSAKVIRAAARRAGGARGRK